MKSFPSCPQTWTQLWNANSAWIQVGVAHALMHYHIVALFSSSLFPMLSQITPLFLFLPFCITIRVAEDAATTLLPSSSYSLHYPSYHMNGLQAAGLCIRPIYLFCDKHKSVPARERSPINKTSALFRDSHQSVCLFSRTSAWPSWDIRPPVFPPPLEAAWSWRLLF